ncbi:membrane-associated protein, putative [Bodo saltans]|uniref:Membrane-associated protein, putative n=1 Tax=Bodo saltans TaxID=75058 RepID=A0A0S4IWA7_BODSA|nr:membrane-associated protein, putative [Bodo saltans]|eukprot:CUG27311.1 membrane-associated protein, putative [Bodo saltans]
MEAVVQLNIDNHSASEQSQQRHHDENNRRHTSHRHCTVPLWFGCAVLCTILVGIVGFSPFLAGQPNSDIIVASARNTYNMVFAMNAQARYYKYLNEVTTPILAFFHAYFQPYTMIAMNFSDPMWDRDWQLFFTGVAALNPERYYYYMDLATGSFTGQYVRGADKLRIVGNVNDVNFTGYRQSATPPLRFTPTAENVSLEFPPIVMFNNFFATGEASGVILPTLATDAELVYGIATYIGSPLTTPTLTVPVGALLELIPLRYLINLSISTPTAQADLTIGTESVVLDYVGALVTSSLPQLADIYLPEGTPGAICNTVTYDHKNISKCRHSLETIRPIWPLLYVAHEAITTNAEGVVTGGFSRIQYVTFYYNGDQFLISASFPLTEDGGWWTAAISPIDPVYGRYIASRRQIVIVVSCVCGGMALLVLLITYALMLPLGNLMEQMIAALKLQSQTDRYSKAQAALATSIDEFGSTTATASTATILVWGNRLFQVSELGEIEDAISQLHQLLNDVAKMLPPPVIARIRASLASRSGDASEAAYAADAAEDNDGCMMSSEDHSDGDVNNMNSSSGRRSPNRRPKKRSIGLNAADDIAEMMMWVDHKYDLCNSPLSPWEAKARSSVPRHGGIFGEVIELAPDPQLAPLDAETAEAVANKNQLRLLEQGNHSEDEAKQTNLTSSGILMNPTVSLRGARRRGFFMAVSLAEFKCGPSEFADIIAPLLSVVWRHGGEVELIERFLLLATFGCYETLDDAADRAAACAVVISEQRPPPHINPSSRFSVTIDCGWFETSTFSCPLPSGFIMRRQVVSSVARDVAVKLAPLADILHEGLLISGDALRFVDPETLRGRVPVIADHLKFDASCWSKVSRRGPVFVFSIPPISQVRQQDSSTTLTNQFVVNEFRRHDARLVTEGFQLMVNAKYAEAEAYFQRFIDKSGSIKSTHRTIQRMLAVASAIARVERFAPESAMAPYYRGECPTFEATIEEQVAFRERENESRNNKRRNFDSAEGPDRVSSFIEPAETHRSNKPKPWRKQRMSERMLGFL